jgi:integrase
MSTYFDYTPARLVTGKRWYIDFYQTDPVDQIKKRVREYRNLNRIKDLKERRKAALNHITHLNAELLPYGYPYVDTKHLPENINVYDAVIMALNIKNRSDRKKTGGTYNSVVKYFLQYMKEHHRDMTPIRDFGFRDAIMFMDFLISDKKIANITYNNYRLFMTAIWNEVIGRGYIHHNPWSKIKKLKVTEKSRRMMTRDEAQHILDYAFAHDRMMALSILLLNYTFIRPGEQRQMRVHMIDLRRGMIHIPGEISKNKKGEHITIPSQVIPYLSELISDQWHVNDYIFGQNMRPHPDIMIGSNTMLNRHNSIVNALVKDKKLRSAKGITLYSWKDTGGMALIKSGVDAYTLMRQMRHQDLETTQKYLKEIGTVNESIRDLKGNILLPTKA